MTGRPSRGLRVQVSTSQVIGCPLFTKASQVESYFTVDICEEGAYIIEGLSGVDDFTSDNEQEDCNHLEDLGVEAYKV